MNPCSCYGYSLRACTSSEATVTRYQKRLLKAATQQLQLSDRGYHRVIKLARTIADLAGSEDISPSHLAEAVQYRPRGRS